jgi:hypothetical protein
MALVRLMLIQDLLDTYGHRNFYDINVVLSHFNAGFDRILQGHRSEPADPTSRWQALLRTSAQNREIFSAAAGRKLLFVAVEEYDRAKSTARRAARALHQFNVPP